MRVIPVLDIKQGLAVHAVAGMRDHYQPLVSRLHPAPDPVALATAYRDQLGFWEVYVADLDAIAGGPPHVALLDRLCGLNLQVWVDAGIRDARSHSVLFESRAATLVAGLETLAGPQALHDMLGAAGRQRIAFSLDLRAGRPVFASDADWGTDAPRAIAETAIDLGVERMILLDLARVGVGSGTGTQELQQVLRAKYPCLELTVGGGISRPEELDLLERAGASAALVGSALHDGRLGAEDCRRFRSRADRS
jgi:phosphoribosylformimino-5-aminoimidazole carboxamide ribotide isomerase